MRPEDPPAVHIEIENEWAWCGARRLALPPRAFAVLRHLVEHRGRLITKDELIAAVWRDAVVSDAAVASGIRDVRKALGDQLAQHPRPRGPVRLPPVRGHPRRPRPARRLRVARAHPGRRRPPLALPRGLSGRHGTPGLRCRSRTVREAPPRRGRVRTHSSPWETSVTARADRSLAGTWGLLRRRPLGGAVAVRATTVGGGRSPPPRFSSGSRSAAPGRGTA